MKPLRYVFYRLYRSDSEPMAALKWIVPLFTTAMGCALNVLCLAELVCWATGGALPERGFADRDVTEGFLVVVATIFLLLYSRWISSGRYIQFAKEFESESRTQYRLRTMLLYVYALVTMFAPVVIGYIISKHR